MRSIYWDQNIPYHDYSDAVREGTRVQAWLRTEGAEVGNGGTGTYRNHADDTASSALDLSFTLGNSRIAHWKAEPFIYSDHRPISFFVEWRDPDGLTERVVRRNAEPSSLIRKRIGMFLIKGLIKLIKHILILLESIGLIISEQKSGDMMKSLEPTKSNWRIVESWLRFGMLRKVYLKVVQWIQFHGGMKS